ncbi:MAG: SAM-dependent methyltransferase [Clostridia bacterium]|nr:SAM-dependent methyltransferase [Clostridia bacterium]
MTVRLCALCALIEKTKSFIDVGCDHGYVVKYVSDNKLAASITACDISAPSLDKARALLGENCGVRFVCADGKHAASGHETVLISGMGGIEIVEIIGGCNPKTFILSPQSHARDVRKTLLEKNYSIEFDRVVYDGKYYDVIKATLGGGTDMLKGASASRLEYGMFLNVKNDALVNKLRSLEKAVASYPPTAANLQKLENIKEALSWQLR